MYVTIETNHSKSEPTKKNKVTIYGITDFEVEKGTSPHWCEVNEDSVRLFWPYGSVMDNAETVIRGEITSGGSISSLDVETFIDLVSDNSSVQYSIIVEHNYNPYTLLTRQKLEYIMSEGHQAINVLCGLESVVILSDYDGYNVPTTTEFPDIEQFMS